MSPLLAFHKIGVPTAAARSVVVPAVEYDDDDGPLYAPKVHNQLDNV